MCGNSSSKSRFHWKVRGTTCERAKNFLTTPAKVLNHTPDHEQELTLFLLSGIPSAWSSHISWFCIFVPQKMNKTQLAHIHKPTPSQWKLTHYKSVRNTLAHTFAPLKSSLSQRCIWIFVGTMSFKSWWDRLLDLHTFFVINTIVTIHHSHRITFGKLQRPVLISYSCSTLLQVCRSLVKCQYETSI